MTAKLTDRERERRARNRGIARSGMPEDEYLALWLEAMEFVIQSRRSSQRTPGTRTLEELCCRRWDVMADITRLKNGHPTHRRNP